MAKQTILLGTAANDSTGTNFRAGGTMINANFTELYTAMDTKAPTASPTFTGTVNGITKAMVGLGSVDNTADTAKPVSTAQQTALDLKANKGVTIKIVTGDYTVGTTDPLELYGGVLYVTAACTLTIPAVAAGMSFSVVTIGAMAVSVDPNASDLIVLDGTPLSDGDKITNTAAAGDVAVFTYYGPTGWFASTNGWSDGN